MGMQVEDGLAGARAVVNYKSKRIKLFLLRYRVDGKKEVGEKRFFGVCAGGQAVDMSFGNRQKVRGRRRFDVAKDQNSIVLIHLVGRKFAPDYAAEYTVRMGSHLGTPFSYH